jgi:hypothetical protein
METMGEEGFLMEWPQTKTDSRTGKENKLLKELSKEELEGKLKDELLKKYWRKKEIVRSYIFKAWKQK